jgi:acetyl esterase/lipase
VRATEHILFISLSLLLINPRCIGQDTGYSLKKDIEYASVEGHSLRLDFYQTQKEELNSPLVVWIHGGAWRSGSKASVPVKHWLDHGFKIASVDYRLSGQARFPAQVHDIKAAIRFLRRHADSFQFDPARIIVAGASAGGHLAALVGVSNGLDELEGTVGKDLQQSSSVCAAVSFYGASNLNSILGQSTAHGLSVRVPALQLLLGGQPDQVPEASRLASPITHVDEMDPPLWLIHGDADPQMPIEQSTELEKMYRKNKLIVRYDIIVGAVHGGPEFYTDQRLADLAAEIHDQIGTER